MARASFAYQDGKLVERAKPLPTTKWYPAQPQPLRGNTHAGAKPAEKKSGGFWVDITAAAFVTALIVIFPPIVILVAVLFGIQYLDKQTSKE